MSVTIELREWIKQHLPNAPTMSKSLLDVADRIDDEVKERYLSLPVDADGVTINFGDVLYSEQAKGNGLFRVYSIEIYEGGGATIGDGGGYFSGVDADSCHRPKNTIENVLMEVIMTCDPESRLSADSVASIVAKYAKSLKESK